MKGIRNVGRRESRVSIIIEQQDPGWLREYIIKRVTGRTANTVERVPAVNGFM